MEEFYRKSNSDLSFIEFSYNLENATSWRPKEDQALYKLFELTTESTKLYLDTFFDNSLEYRGASQYNFFYKLRNSIVHFRAIHNKISLTIREWNDLIHATLHLLDEHYSRNDKILGVS